VGSVFDTTTKCSLPSIPAIGGFDFISDCTVPDAPPPIYECPDLEFDLPFAGPPGPPGVPGPPGIPGAGIPGPCPDFDITAKITQKNGVSEPTIVVTKVPKVQMVSSSSQTLSCEHDINFELNLPCPGLKVVPELTVIDPWKPTKCYDSYSSSSEYVCYKNFKPTLDIQKVEQNSSSSETSECKTVFKFKLGIPITNGWCSGYGKPKLNECPDRFYYLDLDTADVYLKVGDGEDWGIKSGFDDFGRPVSNGWAGPITNLRGSNGSDGSDGRETPMACCPQTYYGSIVTGVYCQGNQLIVQYQS